MPPAEKDPESRNHDRRALVVARRAAGGTRRGVSGRHRGALSLRDGSGGLIDVFLSRRKRVSVMRIFLGQNVRIVIVGSNKLCKYC